MSTQSDIRKLQAYVATLEKELVAVRRALFTVLEKLPLEQAEKEELTALLYVKTFEQEVKPAEIHYDKTIQQLLDESASHPGKKKAR